MEEEEYLAEGPKSTSAEGDEGKPQTTKKTKRKKSAFSAETLEIMQIKHKRKMMKATPAEQAKLDEYEACCLYLGNVPLNWTIVQVKEALRQQLGDNFVCPRAIWTRSVPYADGYWGEMRKVSRRKQLFNAENSDSKDIFMRFRTRQEVEAAQAGLHNISADETHVLRADFVGKHSRLKRLDPKRTVYVSNLPYDATEHSLRKLFADCGTIHVVRIHRDKQTQESRGFAFVRFTERSHVKVALKQSIWPGFVLGNRWIRVVNVERTADSTDDKPARWMRDRWRKKHEAFRREEITAQKRAWYGQPVKKEKKKFVTKTKRELAAEALAKKRRSKTVKNKNARQLLAKSRGQVKQGKTDRERKRLKLVKKNHKSRKR